ncbi:MAG: TolC family protein, partial [Candidatus Aminicenantes bacterium]|nr:TolC family protein [Candidatus Aminicenantes bacterium]
MKLARTATAALLCLAGGLWPQQGREIHLSLDGCIRHALQNNINLAAEVLTPRIDEETVGLANEVFLPRLSLSLAQSSRNSASYSWINASGTITTASGQYAVNLSQLLPTGGRLEANLTSYKTDSTESFLTINPRYGSTLTFDFTQPLLRGFGPTATRSLIIVAQLNRNISRSAFRGIVMDTVTRVEQAYWDLVYSIENLKAKQESLKYARDLLFKNQKELEAGLISPVEILNAKAEVAGREADIIQAEAGVRNSEDLLRTLMNLVGTDTLVPTDSPKLEEKALALDEALRLAFAHRPELEAGRIRIESSDINLGVARNGLLPNLSLNASYWSPGVSGTRILYKDDNPLTNIIIGRVPGESSDALKDALNMRYRNWSVYLTLDIPLDTVLSRAAFARAKLEADQAALRFKNLEQQAALDVQTALRAVETDYRRALGYRAARALEEEKLRAEERKLAAGLSTSYNVLLHQRDLAAARTNELRALADYNLSLARLDRAL